MYDEFFDKPPPGAAPRPRPVRKPWSPFDPLAHYWGAPSESQQKTPSFEPYAAKVRDLDAEAADRADGKPFVERFR